MSGRARAVVHARQVSNMRLVIGAIKVDTIPACGPEGRDESQNLPRRHLRTVISSHLDTSIKTGLAVGGRETVKVVALTEIGRL